MFIEFSAIVGGDGFHAIATLERQQCVDCHLCHVGGHLAVWEVADDGEECAALDEREFEVPALGIGHQVQLPVTEACSVGFRWALLDADAVLYGDALAHRPASVLEFETTVLPQVAAFLLVLVDIVIDAALADHQHPLVAAKPHNLLRRELVVAHILLNTALQLPAHLAWLPEPLFPHIAQLLCLSPRVSPLATIPLQLTTDG